MPRTAILELNRTHFMRTLQEHVDDLDRMVDGGNVPKHEIRSQIAFIGREVAALQADYARLAEAHEELQESQLARIRQLEAENVRLIASNQQPPFEPLGEPTFEPPELPNKRWSRQPDH